MLLTPYPPGIPLLIPGERFNRLIVEYLQFARMFNAKFPGFDTDIHGLVEETIDGQRRYFVDCVRGIAAADADNLEAARRAPLPIGDPTHDPGGAAAGIRTGSPT